MNELISDIETKQTRIIFPKDLNDHETLFGGNVMKWMDEVAYITAIRFAKKKMVTVSVKNIDFLLPVKVGGIIDIIGKIINVKSVKLEIQVEIFIEDIITEKRNKVVNAIFTFAAINDNNKPIMIKKIIEIE